MEKIIIPNELLEPLVTYAIRYCLGRTSYAVGDAQNIVQATWKYLSSRGREVLMRDVHEEIRHNKKRGTPPPEDIQKIWADILKYMQAHQNDLQEATSAYPTIWRNG